MKRFVKTATLAAASCAMVLGGAGIATAGGSDGHRGHSQQGGYGHHGCGHGGHGYGDRGHGGGGRHGCGHGGGADAKGFAVGSPGVFSGNVIQVPINIPINVCGNSLQFIGALNPAFGNICINR